MPAPPFLDQGEKTGHSLRYLRTSAELKQRSELKPHIWDWQKCMAWNKSLSFSICKMGFYYLG